MKKILTIALAAAMAATLAVNSFASVTTFEDDRAEGVSINDPDADGATYDGYLPFRDHATNSRDLDSDKIYDLVVREDDGNRCVKIDFKEAWQTDYSYSADDGTSNVYSFDLRFETLGIFQGIHLYQDTTAETNTEQYSVAVSTDEYIQGCGMTIKTDSTVVVYSMFSGGTVTYTFDTGIDLGADWHNYAAYDNIENGTITFCIDNKVVAVIDRNSSAILDNDGNVAAQGEGTLCTDNPFAGVAFTGEGMELYLDNLTFEVFEPASVPTEKFVATQAGDLDADIDTDEDVDPAPATADLAVVALVALGAFAVAKKH